MKTIGELKSRVWYRFLRVVYIVIIVIAVIIIGFVSWVSRPTKTLDTLNSLIVCDNGKSYPPGKNRISPYISDGELDYYSAQNARILCKYDTLDFYSHQDELIEKNYTFKPVYNKTDYGSWIFGTITALFVLWLLAYLIKGCFYYIVLGSFRPPK